MITNHIAAAIVAVCYLLPSTQANASPTQWKLIDGQVVEGELRTLQNNKVHIDESGNAHNIKNYIEALQRGKTEQEAQILLLNGRSYETLEKSFSKFCAQKGLILEFQ